MEYNEYDDPFSDNRSAEPDKPTSKIIQICSAAPDGRDTGGVHFILNALCEDGSLWEYVQGEWKCILPSID